MIAIRAEIAAIVERGEADREDNLLKNAPHTAGRAAGRDWDTALRPRAGGLPAAVGRASDKYWPPVGRIDNAYGDRNLVCACPPMEAYQQAAE